MILMLAEKLTWRLMSRLGMVRTEQTDKWPIFYLKPNI